MRKRLKKTGQRAAAVMAALCMIGAAALPVQAAGLKTLGQEWMPLSGRDGRKLLWGAV